MSVCGHAQRLRTLRGDFPRAKEAAPPLLPEPRPGARKTRSAKLDPFVPLLAIISSMVAGGVPGVQPPSPRVQRSWRAVACMAAADRLQQRARFGRQTSTPYSAALPVDSSPTSAALTQASQLLPPYPRPPGAVKRKGWKGSILRPSLSEIACWNLGCSSPRQNAKTLIWREPSRVCSAPMLPRAPLFTFPMARDMPLYQNIVLDVSN